MLVRTQNLEVTCYYVPYKVSFSDWYMYGGLVKSIVIGEEFPVLPPGYSISEGQLAFSEEWDKTVKLHSYSKEGKYRFVAHGSL